MNKPFEKDPTEQFMLFPNTIIDDLMPALAPPAFKIVCLIYRNTKGWHKEVDQISFSQIMRETGIKSSATVAKHLENLAQRGVILRAKGSGTWDANSYALNPQFDVSTLKNEVEPTLKNEVEPTLKNEDTKDTPKKQKNIPLEKKSSGLSLKTQTDNPQNVLVDTKAPYVVDEQTQSALAAPDPIAQYVADSAQSTAETLDKEIMGEANLDDVFGPNERQADIDAYQAKERQPVNADELLLGAMVGSTSAAVRSKLTQMRRQGWQVKDSEIELALAQFFEITQFVMPTNKSRRKFFVSGVRDHIQEEAFSGRIAELYEAVWSNIAADVAAGDLEITSPKSLTSFMYGILNREAGPVSELTRAQLIDRLTNEGLVEIIEINRGVGFIWVETGKLVGEIPAEIVARYSGSK